MRIFQVTTRYFCAAYTMKDGKVITISPILRKKFDYWKTIAVEITK